MSGTPVHRCVPASRAGRRPLAEFRQGRIDRIDGGTWAMGIVRNDWTCLACYNSG
jgi:hypothetical protein